MSDDENIRQIATRLTLVDEKVDTALRQTAEQQQINVLMDRLFDAHRDRVDALSKQVDLMFQLIESLMGLKK